MPLFFSVIIFEMFLFTSCTFLNEGHVVESGDTISIYNAAIAHAEFKQYLENAPNDTIYVILNEYYQGKIPLGIRKKVVSFTEKPYGYPKRGRFDYNKLQISFERIEIKDGNATCLIMIKTIGVIGEFKLKKSKQGWRVWSYNKIMI